LVLMFYDSPYVLPVVKLLEINPPANRKITYIHT